MPTTHKYRLAYAERPRDLCESDRQRGNRFRPGGRLQWPSRPTLNARTALKVRGIPARVCGAGSYTGYLAALGVRWPYLPVATFHRGAHLRRRLRLPRGRCACKEVLCHLGRQVLGRILQSFSREAIQVRLDESGDAALILAAELPQDPAHPRLREPLLAS